MSEWKPYIPGCLGVIFGCFAAAGIIFLVLKPLGIADWPGGTVLGTALLIVCIGGGIALFYAYFGQRDDSWKL